MVLVREKMRQLRNCCEWNLYGGIVGEAVHSIPVYYTEWHMYL